MADTLRQKKSDRLLKLEQQRAALQRKIALEETRLKTQERKVDTRRKIIAGAIVLTHADIREAFKDILYELLQKFVEPKDKNIFPEVFTPEEIAQAASEVQKARNRKPEARNQHGNTAGDTASITDQDDQAGQPPQNLTALEGLKKTSKPRTPRQPRTARNLDRLRKQT